MSKKLLIIFLSLFPIYLLGQNKENLKLIKATSPLVDTRVDSILYKQEWRINPKLNPDIFDCKEDAKKVTFYTDIDSISFDIVPQGVYDFGILVNEVDTAWTQIAATQPNYLARLKQAKEYNSNDKRAIAPWQYMDKNDPSLQALRIEFNLDSIAGSGDEMSKIINLMTWLHKLVRHDGNSSNPEPYNAHNIINVCKTENRGANCRMLAITLNECNLAMGIDSRYVTCMPKDTESQDCHVINAVYSKDLDKWVWIDPSFDGFVKDENGTYLSIEEVRERLIDGHPLFANKDLNWNDRPVTQEYYLNQYMAKNLYLLQCIANSAYGTETDKADEKKLWNELLPLDEQEQETVEGRQYTIYKTNNPDLFWQKPQH